MNRKAEADIRLKNQGLRAYKTIRYGIKVSPTWMYGVLKA